MRILLTAFEPFGGDSENASLATLQLLEDQWSGDEELICALLSVTFDQSGFLALVEEHLPDVVVALGEAGGREAITVERWGVNEQRARIPDNAGAQPDGELVVEGASERREATLDPQLIVDAVRDDGWAAEVSDDAGRFVCNTVAFLAYGLDVPAIFIHVPALRSTGVATVGAETGGATTATGNLAENVEDLAAAIAAALTCL